MAKDIQQTWFFTQPPNEVWNYLTDAGLIEQWLGKTDFKPLVGHKFQFTNSCDTPDGKPHFTFCKVLELIPDKLLAYSWQKGTTEQEIKLDSVVRWTLAEKKAALN
ncbi:MAG: SRPBCC domain-containing protein [Bacteroidetes bacterium]|nr:SRPBCC domain-containing protein [Bacteroidota bacterium]